MLPTTDSLNEFISYTQKYFYQEIKHSQPFLTRFFQLFGHNLEEVGAELETFVENSSVKGNKGRADLIWKQGIGIKGVIIEMKSKDVDLFSPEYYRQLERYWINCVPNRPRYGILCNFDQFLIFDFDIQPSDPIDVIKLTDLPDRITAFRFMEIGGQSSSSNRENCKKNG